MARYEISNEVRPLDRLITGFASSCGYEIQTVFNDLLRFIIHGFSPGAPPISNWKYKRQQNASFMEMTAEWTRIMQMEMTTEWTRIMQKQIGRSGWFDAFGELHMAYCSKPGQQTNGQFFTPSHICELMVMCAAGKKETGQRMGDPTCGSGRLLLARPHMRQRKTPAGIPCAQSGELSGRRRHQPDLLHDDRMQHARPRMCRGSVLS